MRSRCVVLLALVLWGLAGRALPAADDYHLAPDDLLDFRVFQEPELNAVVRISGDGSANFPAIGKMTVAGMTVSEAADFLRKKYQDGYIIDPQVSIIVRSYAKKRFTVLGQVQKPGSYEIQGTESISLLQAIGLAGGYTRIADPGRITVKRRVDGKEEVLRFNAKQMVDGSADSSFQIRADDVISVGETRF